MYRDNSNLIQYVVKKDDTLYLIAKAYNVTVDEIKSINHLYSNTIYPNQILFIPISNQSSVGCKTYLTNQGESISDILAKNNITLKQLESMNDIDRLKLEANQLLCVNMNDDTKKTHKVVATDSVEYLLAKYNLSPLDFLHLNESKWLNIGEEVIVG